jgi:hypothetical protein
LALALGMTVAQLLRSIDSRELTEWFEYYRLEPFGEGRADLRAGIVASTTANVWRGKGSRPFLPKDFMPNFEPKKKKPQTADEMKEIAKAWNAVFGGEVVRRG